MLNGQERRKSGRLHEGGIYPWFLQRSWQTWCKQRLAQDPFGAWQKEFCGVRVLDHRVRQAGHVRR